MLKPLALYIHWPFCKSKCPYCDFNSHVREGIDAAAWQRAYLREMAHLAAHLPGREVVSVFFGGGTPSLMPPTLAGALLEEAAKYWNFARDAEITLEANPTSVEAEKFKGFRAAGINRVSLGIQAMNDADLKFLGREHSAAEAMKAVQLAAEHFPRYSFDLIYARPNQTVDAWEKELREALAHARGHLSLYQLTIEENTAFHHAYKKGEFTLPEEDVAAEMYDLTETLAGEAGMRLYEVSNYAAHGQESRHNLAYWRGEEYVGIGPGAHGRLNLPEGRTATAMLKSPERWLSAVEAQGHGIEVWRALPAAEADEERLMMRLRITEPLDLREFPGINRQKAEQLQRHGLVALTADTLTLTRKGRLLLNHVTVELMG